MRAQVRKTTLHDPADPSPPSPLSPGQPSPQRSRTRAGARSHAARRRRASVRNRLLAALLLTGAAVLGAGAPGVQAAVDKLGHSRQQVDDAKLALRTLKLAHTLADERGALVIAAAAGEDATGAGLSAGDRKLADRQAADVAPDVSAGVRDRLEEDLPRARERALSGKATAAQTNTAYTRIIRTLVSVAREGTSDSGLFELAVAADISSATRALLVAALGAGGGQPELTSQAQRLAARENDALDAFGAATSAEGRAAYEEALSGSATQAAEDYLRELTAESSLSEKAQRMDEQAVNGALAARTDKQRSVLITLASQEIDSLSQAYRNDVISLCLRAALVAGALLLALAISIRTARSLTRPLAAIRLGSRRVAADPEGQDPVKYTGRNDEFAEVVASVNALHARAVELHRQAGEMARDRGGLRAERDRLLAEQQELASRLTALHGAFHGMFACHAQRLLALAGDQLAVLERLEKNETDPDHLSVLFTLDHLAARMRRHGENLLLLAGAGPAGRQADRTPLIDVLRAAISEIERYELAEITPTPPDVLVTGPAARDVSHLLAELLDNATACSPEGARVRLTGQLRDGYLALTVTDEGAVLAPERLAALNARLADAVTPPAVGEESANMGLYTVARLAARHGLRCWLTARPGGGTLAEVTLPAALLTEPQLSPAAGAEPAGSARLAADTGEWAVGAQPVRDRAAGEPHATPAGGIPAPGGPPEHARADDSAPQAQASTTASGLPLRVQVPRPGQPPAAPSAPTSGPIPGPAAGTPTPARGVDAEELRRRLDGFQRGAREGHRDAARSPYPATGEETPS